MARAKLTNVTEDVSSDSGAVLWSFVKGEQLEYPITLDFLDNAPIGGYTFEAVVIEADNMEDQLDKPLAVKAGGVQTTLTVRKPNLVGDWFPSNAYNYENVVLYEGNYYRLLNGVSRVSATTPDVDPLWEPTVLNKVYVQFPETLADDWSVQPSVVGNVYGFFELAVREPENVILRRRWKPVRGMVEILYSPTDVVPDV